MLDHRWMSALGALWWLAAACGQEPAPGPGPRYLSATLPADAPATEPVRITGGLITGGILPDGVRTFRGIPFAEAPVGALRWTAPQAPRPWQGVRRATRFGPQCMQPPIFPDMVFRSDGMSEDCLYLNVWTPARAPGQRLPVLLYIYGGAFVGGDGSELRYDGESLARRGIVVVTTNYRLGVFGFLAHPELTRESPHRASGNYGLLDQAAALGWVRQNIAAFGGDPYRVTIGGESAGSISVCALMASPLSRGLIAGAIGESGGMIYPTFAPVPLGEAEQHGAAFAHSVGAVAPESTVRTARRTERSDGHASSGAASLEALRALPAERLLKASGRAQFAAVVDGWFLPQAPAEIFAAGQQAKVPLLVGWNLLEAGWRALLGDREPTPQNYAAVLDSLYGADAGEALRLFPGTTPQQVMESGTLLAGARFIAYSTWKWAELQGRAGKRPVYRYLFVHPRPATIAPAASPPPAGAVHSAEIEYALGNLATNRVYAWTAADDSLSGLMEGYFAAFVKTGNPNGRGLPHWPAAYSDDSARVMILGVRSRAESGPHEDAFRFLDRIYRAGGNRVSRRRRSARRPQRRLGDYRAGGNRVSRRRRSARRPQRRLGGYRSSTSSP